MPGITVDEGRTYFGNILYKGGTQEELTLGLFTNAAGTLTATSVWADIAQPTGTGYAEIDLSQATWVNTNGILTYPQQQWTAAADWNLPVQGYYVRNRNASPVLVHIEYRNDGGFTMLNGRIYTVDTSIDSS